MIVDVADREQVLESIVRSDVPAMTFMIHRSAELLRRLRPEDVDEGRKILLSAAHRADEICTKLTALVELEARGGKDL